MNDPNEESFTLFPRAKEAEIEADRAEQEAAPPTPTQSNNGSNADPR